MMRIVFNSSVAWATRRRAAKPGKPAWRARVAAEWRAFRKSRPGKRFEARYHRLRKADSPLRLVLGPLIGAGLVAIGLFMLAVPGPGIPVIAVGLALLGEHFLWMARLLDRCEPPLRAAIGWCRVSWQAASLVVRRVIALVGATLAFLAGLLVVTLVA